MAGRWLRRRLINDDDPGRAFNPPFIEVVKCPTGFGDNKPQLATWDQHIWLWGKGQVPNFDLLLIDIKFERDTTDPRYFGEREGPQLLTPLPQPAPNPFGLLHALPLAARQDLTNMPFVWGVHSGDPRAIQNDPVAIWALGLLYAMERRKGWDGDGYYSTKPASLSAYFQAQLKDMQAFDPQQAWRSLLLPYRTRLLEACTTARVKVELNALQKLIATAEEIARATENPVEALARLANESLFLSTGGYEEDDHALVLQSLFADVERWDRRTVETEVLGYLRQLRDAAASVSIFPHVCEIICKLEADPDARLTLMDVLPRTGYKAWIAVGVIVCLWLRRFHKGGKGVRRRAQDLLTDMGFAQGKKSPNAHAPNRLLEEALGYSMPLGKFLKKLESEPLEPVWRECGREFYYNDVLRGNVDGQWPACLGQE